MMIGVACSSGNDATISKPLAIARSWLLDPHPHVPVDDRGAPLAWKPM